MSIEQQIKDMLQDSSDNDGQDWEVLECLKNYATGLVYAMIELEAVDLVSDDLSEGHKYALEMISNIEG